MIEGEITTAEMESKSSILAMSLNFIINTILKIFISICFNFVNLSFDICKIVWVFLYHTFIISFAQIFFNLFQLLLSIGNFFINYLDDNFSQKFQSFNQYIFTNFLSSQYNYSIALRYLVLIYVIIVICILLVLKITWPWARPLKCKFFGFLIRNIGKLIQWLKNKLKSFLLVGLDKLIPFFGKLVWPLLFNIGWLIQSIKNLRQWSFEVIQDLIFQIRNLFLRMYINVYIFVIESLLNSFLQFLVLIIPTLFLLFEQITIYQCYGNQLLTYLTLMHYNKIQNQPNNYIMVIVIVVNTLDLLYEAKKCFQICLWIIRLIGILVFVYKILIDSFLVQFFRNNNFWIERLRRYRQQNAFTTVVFAFGCQILIFLKKNFTKIMVIVIFYLINSQAQSFCLHFFNPSGMWFQTQWTRSECTKYRCDKIQPCAVYLTIPETADKSVFINFHTRENVTDVNIRYRIANSKKTFTFSQNSHHTFYLLDEPQDQRRQVHSILLDNLKGNLMYEAQIMYNYVSIKNLTFKTLPSEGQIRMINAGDGGYNNITKIFAKNIGEIKPDVFFIGGDIIYDNNLKNCIFMWDYFFQLYEIMTNISEYYFPIVLIVGNHDVGLEQLSMANITATTSGPMFLLYFPQHFDTDSEGKILRKVPELENRRKYFDYTFGNINYLVLDSGYVQNYSSQAKFIRNCFEANKEKIKMVSYHVPIYQACGQSNHPDSTKKTSSITAWRSLFDQYHVMISFQNHVHSFKRTKPLVASQPTNYGTVYVGDGAFGADLIKECQFNSKINPSIKFDAFAKRNNIWLSVITEEKVIHQAFAPNNILIDEFVQYTKDYKKWTYREIIQMNENDKICIRNSYGEYKQVALNGSYQDEDVDQMLPILCYKELAQKEKSSKIASNIGTQVTENSQEGKQLYEQL